MDSTEAYGMGPGAGGAEAAADSTAENERTDDCLEEEGRKEKCILHTDTTKPPFLKQRRF